MLIIGHRGACGYEPENTISSFKKALELGVDMIELDVHLIETGELVVIHDDKVDRTTDGTGYVTDFSFEQLRTLDAGNGQQIPTLQEVLDLIDKHVPVNIELKGHGTAKAVADVIDEYKSKGWHDDHFLISSFNHIELDEFRKLQPDIKRGALVGTIPIDYAAFAEQLGAHTVNPSAEFISQAFVDDAHRRGMKVLVHIVNDQSEVERKNALGVDGVFTNFPDKTRSYLN